MRERSQEAIIIFLITNSESDAIKNEERLVQDWEERRLKQSDEETELTRLNSNEERAKLTEMSIKLFLNALKSIN